MNAALGKEDTVQKETWNEKRGTEHCMNRSIEELEGANSVSIEEEDGVLELYTEREEYRIQKKGTV